MTVRVLSGPDVDRLLDLDADLDAALDAVATAFRRRAEPAEPAEPAAAPEQRIVLPLDDRNRATVLAPGRLAGVPAYTVKVNAKFPGQPRAITGVVCLHSDTTGELLALIESGRLTAWRTGIAAAVGTDALARPDARVLSVLGAGQQARATVVALLRLRPRWDRVLVHDPVPEAARRFADRLRADGREAEVVDRAGAAVAAADTVVTATWAREPVLAARDVAAGAHVTSLGADELGKAELPAELLAEARLVVDSRALVEAGGATATAGLAPASIDAELADVLAGAVPARTDDRDRTVYAPVGEPWLDLALAWHLLDRAGRSEGVGTTVASWT